MKIRCRRRGRILLQVDAEALLGLLKAIEMKVEMINRMAHLTPVRTYRLTVVTYPQRFELRDRRADLDFLVRAKEVTAKIGSPTLRREIDRQLALMVLERVDVLEVVEGKFGGRSC